jgi:hypothetical protein
MAKLLVSVLSFFTTGILVDFLGGVVIMGTEFLNANVMLMKYFHA